MLTPGDELLAAVSARETLSWRAFRDAFDELHMCATANGAGVEGDAGWIRSRTLRLLSDLAHAEITNYGKTPAIAIAPTLFSRLPQPGLPRMVLTGSRGLGGAKTLKEAFKSFGKGVEVIEVKPQPCGGYAPTTILVQAVEDSLLLSAAQRVGIPLLETPPAWRLLHSSASLDDYQETLEWNRDPDPGWPRKDFNQSTLSFRFPRHPEEHRLSTFTDSVSHRQVNRLWRNGLATTDNHGRDWARWLFLSQRDVGVLSFDRDAQTLGVPVTVPLPPLLARALTLFSGVPARRHNHPENAARNVDIYTGVPGEAAKLLAMKIGQPPPKQSLREDN